MSGKPASAIQIEKLFANTLAKPISVSARIYHDRFLPKSAEASTVKRRWRDYRTPVGRRPVKEFLDRLGDEDAASVLAGMLEVRRDGLRAARHLRGDLYEVRADGHQVSFRILFAVEGHRGQILLALEGIRKKSQKTPTATIRLAERRLADWRRRGRARSQEE